MSLGVASDFGLQWMEERPHADIVLSTRVRLAQPQGHTFGTRPQGDEPEQIRSRVRGRQRTGP